MGQRKMEFRDNLQIMDLKHLFPNKFPVILNRTNLNAAQRKLSVKTLNTFVGYVAILLQFSNISCNTQTFVGQRDVAICNAQKFLSLNFRKWKVVLKPGLIDEEENVSKIVNFIRPEDLGWKYLRKSLAWESIYMERSSGGR